MGCSESYLKNDQLIVGGQVVDYTDDTADYVVSINSVDEVGNNSVCTGVFVATNLVLTAKHCLKSHISNVSMTFRTRDYKRTGHVVNLPVTNSSEVAVPSGVRDDLLLLEFSEAFPETAKVAKISSLLHLSLEDDFFVAGYGLSNQKKNNLEKLALDDNLRSKKISAKHIVNYDHYFLIDQKSAGGGVCQGDSGGPVFYFNSRSKIMNLIGIASAVTSQEVGSGCLDQSYIIKTDFLKINTEAK